MKNYERRPRHKMRGKPGQIKPDSLVPLAQRHQVVEEWLAEYPEPQRLLYAMYPRLMGKAQTVGIDRSEAYSLCLLGVARAARLYDPRVNQRFQTYALWYMRAAVQHEVDNRCAAFRTPANDARVISLTPMIGRDVEGDLSEQLPSREEDPAEIVARNEPSHLCDRVRVILREVEYSQRGQEIVAWLWGLDRGGERRTLRETGRRFGITRTRVQQYASRVQPLVAARLAQQYQPQV